MPKQYREYRGVSDLVVAKIIKDDADSYETGEVRDFAGVNTIEKTSETSQETKYYDNIPAIVVKSEGADDIKLQCSVVDLEQDAFLTGKIYDEETGSLIDGDTEDAYYAIGYKTKDTSGNDRYVWRYKGTITKGAETHITQDDGTESNGVEYTFTGIKTAHKFTKGGNAKALIVEVEKGLADVSTFFDTVTTPDQLKAKA